MRSTAEGDECAARSEGHGGVERAADASLGGVSGAVGVEAAHEVAGGTAGQAAGGHVGSSASRTAPMASRTAAVVAQPASRGQVMVRWRRASR